MSKHLMDPTKKPPGDPSFDDRTVMSFLKEINKEPPEDSKVVMYVLVNNDLKMGKGKIASQTAHSVGKMTRILERTVVKNKPDYYPDYYYDIWLKTGHATVVLKTTQKEMESLIEKYELSKDTHFGANWCVHTRDQGRTQIAPHSLTTLAFRPIMKKFIPEEVTKMKLL